MINSERWHPYSWKLQKSKAPKRLDVNGGKPLPPILMVVSGTLVNSKIMTMLFLNGTSASMQEAMKQPRNIDTCTDFSWLQLSML